MNKLILAFALYILPRIAQSQPTFEVYVDAPDTLTTFFGQDLCRVWSTTIPTIDLDPAYTVKNRVDTSHLMIQFPGFDWIMVAYSKTEGCSINWDCEWELVDYVRDNESINLIPLYDEVPGLLDAVKQGSPALLRYQLYASFDDGRTYNFIYSQPDTIFVPPATNEDIEAFAFFREKNEGRVRDLAYLENIGEMSNSTLQYMIDHYPTSLVAEYARFIKGRHQLTSWVARDGPFDRSEYEVLRKAYYESFRHSKSYIIQQYALIFLK